MKIGILGSGDVGQAIEACRRGRTYGYPIHLADKK